MNISNILGNLRAEGFSDAHYVIVHHHEITCIVQFHLPREMGTAFRRENNCQHTNGDNGDNKCIAIGDNGSPLTTKNGAIGENHSSS